MFFVGSIGILPFLDLLDYLLKKSIYLVAKKLNGEEFAKRFVDYQQIGLDTCLNNSKFYFYFSFKHRG